MLARGLCGCCGRGNRDTEDSFQLFNLTGQVGIDAVKLVARHVLGLGLGFRLGESDNLARDEGWESRTIGSLDVHAVALAGGIEEGHLGVGRHLVRLCAVDARDVHEAVDRLLLLLLGEHRGGSRRHVSLRLIGRELLAHGLWDVGIRIGHVAPSDTKKAAIVRRLHCVS